MDLREAYTVLKAHWWAVLVAVLIGGLLAYALSALVTPKYSSKAQLYVTTEAGGRGATVAYQSNLASQQRVRSYAELLSSNDVARKISEESGYGLSPSQVVSKISAVTNARTVLLSLVVTDTDPERAQALAAAASKVLAETVRDLETPEGEVVPLAKLTPVAEPQLPSSPVSPSIRQNVLLGLLAGLFTGVTGLLVRHRLDRKIRSKQQIEELISRPVLETIPFRQDGEEGQGSVHLVPFREGYSPAAEAFRRLRTNLQFLNVDNPPKILVFTSSLAGEGKSETSINSALALSEAGSSVLLIEADLRRPKLVSYMGMSDKVGITNILAGQADFDSVVQDTEFEGLDVLGCGPLPPNPSELLASEACHRLLNSLRDKYDFVIIDSPPLLPVTDAVLLTRFADGALMIIRNGRTTIEQVSRATENLRKADANLFGAVLVSNKPSKEKEKGYYESYYSSEEPSKIEAL